ncbi:MAG: hypothetical protein HXX10_14700 [Rhodoplanes sp.]|nr:hypothetical protein [Rhodoplanes sp.]
MIVSDERDFSEVGSVFRWLSRQANEELRAIRRYTAGEYEWPVCSVAGRARQQAGAERPGGKRGSNQHRSHD